MAIKKSDLYSSLWASCDELRGDKINTRIIQPLIDANSRLAKSDFPDFNDPNKLGEGKDMVERLSNLIAIFQKPGLDFSKNRAENDDILGDAYEYLMRHFASQSGKSKGQFYTLSDPKFKNGEDLRTYDYVVANPPFAAKVEEHLKKMEVTA